MKPAYFEFFCPTKILCGRKALPNLPHELGQLGCTRPLLLTDKGVAGAGLVKPVEQALADAGMAFAARYDEVPVDSSNRVVGRIAKLYREQGCDGIVALGGGSVIDTAKGTNVLVSEGADDLLAFQGVDRLKAPSRPLVILPTTAGTGSEVTAAAVILDEEQGEKIALLSGRIYPHVALVDPVLTTTMPPRVTAATGMDALTHAVEALTGIQANPVSDAFAAGAIRLVARHLTRAVEAGADEDARLGMATAALLAGMAFSNSMVGVVHAMAHATGALAHVPHGVANAILLPVGMAWNQDVAADALAAVCDAAGAAPADAPVHERAQAAVAWVRSLNDALAAACGFPTRLRDVGVDQDRLPAIADLAINDGSITYNPAELTRDEVLGLLRQAW